MWRHTSLSTPQLQNLSFDLDSTGEAFMKTRTSMALMILAIYCFCSSIAGTQTKPNFSGTWKMNREKSKFENLDSTRSIIAKIEHKEPHFSELVTLTHDHGEYTVEGNYTTDGEESEVQSPSGALKATAKWEVDALIVEWKNEGFHVRRKYTLSADGKTFTSTDRRYTTNGEVDGITVFEKK
jgi:hypothetical protein